jgi:hypothetical protein
MIQRSRKKNNLRQRRYEDRRLDYFIIFDEEWLIRWDIRVDRLCVEEQNSHNSNDRHWCHWIRIDWWVSRAIILWNSEYWIRSIDKKETSKSLWRKKKSSYHSCHLFKNDDLRTYREFNLYADHQTETADSDTRKIMNA